VLFHGDGGFMPFGMMFMIFYIIVVIYFFIQITSINKGIQRIASALEEKQHE